MRLFRLSVLSTFIATAVFSQTALAAAYQLYEVGAPIIGTAEVGQAAVAQDASIAYYNPAGMALLDRSQFLLGSQVLLPYFNFSRGDNTTISGDNGGSAGSLVPGMGLFYVYSYNPCLKFGLSLTTPYGGSLTYNDGWLGRYNVQNVLFYTFNLNPSAAWKVNNWLDLGAGVAVEYINLQQTTALPTPVRDVDGQINLKVGNTSAGFNVGAMLTPYPTTKIGVAYRSQITHVMHGNITFLRIATTPSVRTSMIDPQYVMASLDQAMTNKFNLLAEVGWQNWSVMQNTTLRVAGLALTTPLKWKDTYRVGLGGQYHVTPALMLQAGASYDSSPTTASRRLPVLPMDKQIRVGIGSTYALQQAVTLGISYEYINFGKAPINNVSSTGVIQGSYWRNWGNIVQISLNVDV